jgi:hypothetical protein
MYQKHIMIEHLEKEKKRKQDEVAGSRHQSPSLSLSLSLSPLFFSLLINMLEIGPP